MARLKWVHSLADKRVVVKYHSKVQQKPDCVVVSLPGIKKRYRGMKKRMASLEEADDIAIQRRIKAALKSYREMRGWNQQQMAHFLHITKDNYQRYEQDKPGVKNRKVPTVVLYRFAEFTNQNSHDIMSPPRKRAANG